MVLLLSAVRAIVIVSFPAIHSWTVFLVAVEYFQEESSYEVAVAWVWSESEPYVQKNGDRARFDRQRRAKIHHRTRIRQLWKSVKAQKTPSAQTVDRPGKTLGSPETDPTKKSAMESTDRGA
jgi:hypothetical protein